MDLIGFRYHGLSVAVRREIDRATWASGWPSCFYLPQKTGSCSLLQTPIVHTSSHGRRFRGC